MTIAAKRGVFIAKVAANERICSEHYRMAVSLENFPPSRPGQFIQIQCRPPADQASWLETNWPEDRPAKLCQPELADTEPLLRRPISLAGRADNGGRTTLEIIYRAAGTGTHWLAGAKSDDPLSILGPLGNGFTIRPGKKLAILVGGGVGIPPMLYLAKALADADTRTISFCGARSASVLPLTITSRPSAQDDLTPLPCVGELARLKTDAILATDDGSLGFKGFVSDALHLWIKIFERAGEKPDHTNTVVYCCGPEAMMKNVARVCMDRRIECQLALERHMACGMGTCQSCVVKGRADNDRGWEFKLCCADGPVFDASTLMW
ncbi:MAG: dihydroorotate dehydrogenase electron transfer subunit [Planctomycetes bacterium]|nr:dihydroorotate dehydrogenase electron transfer subunit [Planctomycetota bacterium]